MSLGGDDETDQLFLQEQVGTIPCLQLAGAVAKPLAVLPILKTKAADLLFMDVVCRQFSVDSLRQAPPHLFLRIHKSFVVASWKVNNMGSRHGLVGQSQIPVRASYRQKAEQALMPT